MTAPSKATYERKRKKLTQDQKKYLPETYGHKAVVKNSPVKVICPKKGKVLEIIDINDARYFAAQRSPKFNTVFGKNTSKAYDVIMEKEEVQKIIVDTVHYLG